MEPAMSPPLGWPILRKFDNLSVQFKASLASALLLVCLLGLGAHAYQVKPSDWNSYLELIDVLQKYWTSGNIPAESPHVHG